MDKIELYPLFSSECYIKNKILLIPASQFDKLYGKSMDDIRMFILVCKGELSLKIDGIPCPMKAFSFLDVLDRIHVEILEGSDDLEAYGLITEYEFVSESLKTFKPGPETYLLDRLRFPVLHFSEKEGNVLKQQLGLMKSVLGNPAHCYREELMLVYLKSFMMEIGNILFAHINDCDEMDERYQSNVVSKSDIVAMEFTKLVWKHSIVEHGVDFYANRLCISVKYLSRLVKESMDKTPHEIIRDELIKHAKSMLEDGTIPVGLIAERLCFADQASFCKFFKKHTAVSPMVYRKRLEDKMPQS